MEPMTILTGLGVFGALFAVAIKCCINDREEQKQPKPSTAAQPSYVEPLQPAIKCKSCGGIHDFIRCPYCGTPR